ncbi:mannose-P-dolichol utilization defect 1 protein isoform 1-T1 [Ammospiza maritima maritima]
MEPLRPWLVPFLLPEHCFDRFFLHFQLLDVLCLKILLSKVLGYGIVAGSVLVKVPQLLKVWGSRSGGGLSLPSVLLELLALGGSVGYGCARGFPFRAGARGRFWGVFGDFGVTSDPAELRHRPAGPEPAHHHPQQADPDRHQRPAGPHGAALGGLHGAPVWGGPGPDLHLPHGNRGSPLGLDLRGLGHLQRGPAGPGAAPGGLPGPPPQKGVTPKSPAPQKNPKIAPKIPSKIEIFWGLKRGFLG